MATKLGDLTVGADGTWSSGPHTLGAGARSVTLRRKSDGSILVTRGFTVANGAGFTDNFNRHSSAPTFVSANSYVVGDIVKEGSPALAYRCIQNRSVGQPGPGTNAYWERYIADDNSWIALTSSNYPTLLPDLGAAFGLGVHSGTFNADQYVEARIPGTGMDSGGVIARASYGTGLTAYILSKGWYDDYDTLSYPTVSLSRQVNGVAYPLATSQEGEMDGKNYVRLEVSGVGSSVSLTTKVKANAGDAWTTLASMSYSDTSPSRIVSANPAGMFSTSTTYYIDDWAGGNL